MEQYNTVMIKWYCDDSVVYRDHSILKGHDIIEHSEITIGR